jgi:phosphoglycolate phosphatase
MSGKWWSAPQVVLFDLDGTLVDSFPGIASALQHVVAEMGLNTVEDADLKPLIGPPIQVGLQRQFGLSGPRLEGGIRLFREHYRAHGLLRFSKYQGVEQMLLDLRSRGFSLCIATSKLRAFAVAIVEHAGWADLFDVLGGAEPDGTTYCKKDVIEWTMIHLPSEACVVAMVGDRADDITASREIGLRGIGVTWGYGSVTELDEAGATITVESPDQLFATLTELAGVPQRRAGEAQSH